MSFKASLGSDIIQSFKFLNYCRKPTTYTCRVDKLGPGGKPASQQPGGEAVAAAPAGKGGKGGAAGQASAVQVDFSVETPTIAAPPTDSPDGSEVTINVRYEPSSLGESSGILLLSSPEGGEYQCIL
jgi:hydrocephalus-inducing protein